MNNFSIAADKIVRKNKTGTAESAVPYRLFHAIFFKQIFDLFVWVDYLADRNIVVDSFNKVSDVLRNVNFVEPRS